MIFVFVEYAAILFSVISIFLASINSVQTWWTAIVGSLLFALTFWHVQLYADVTLQFFFIAISLKGWHRWLKGGNKKNPLPISKIRIVNIFIFVFIGAVLSCAYEFFILKNTNASYPLWDSFILIFSVLAQILLMQRKLQNWLFWICIDAAAAPLYYIKGLHFTALLYLWFCFNALFGYLNWRKIYKKKHRKVNSTLN